MRIDPPQLAPAPTMLDVEASGFGRRTGRIGMHRPKRPTTFRTMNLQLACQTVYTDGWINHYSWLDALFDAADMTPRFKLENLRALLSDNEADQWHSVKAQIGSARCVQRLRGTMVTHQKPD